MSESMEIRKGQKFLCINTVIMMDTDSEIAYLKGEVYFSENDNCITDIQRDKYHGWNNLGSDKWVQFFEVINE